MSILYPPQQVPRWLSALLLLLLLVTAAQSFAQNSETITGTVTDDKGAGLPGATVVVRGTTNGTSTDAQGKFTLQNVSNGPVTLTISFVGYVAKEVTAQPGQRENLRVNLASESRQVDEVVVTGVFDKRERMDASIAISTVSGAQVALQVPVSATDLLKNVPGVFVNSTSGEIRNSVYSRGISANSTSGLGYYYVSMQEDGLPVTNATFTDYGPDYFLRADATLGRLEAVRGGSAAITGPNAPGGIFNYVSKTGGQTFGGEVRTKFGLEGDSNPFYRLDANVGGKLNKKGDLTFNAGGFYRYSNGFRYFGYPLNKGGQGKFNIVKTYGKGTLKVYAKYLNDRNGFFDALPATGFNKPSIASGLSNTDTFSPGKTVKFDFPLNSPNDIRRWDPADLVHSRERAVGLDWQHDLGSGWSFQNNVKYSSKSRDYNATLLISPVSLTDIYPYFFTGGLGTFGTYTFKDALTGQTRATIAQTPKIVGGQFAGFNFTPVGTGDLPGQNIQANSVLFTPLTHNELEVREVMDQGSVTKKFSDNFSVTAGTYLGVTDIDYIGGTAGGTLSTIEDQPHQLVMSAVGFDGKTYQFTNPQGVAGTGGFQGGGFNSNKYRQRQASGFAAITWVVAPKLTFDGGLRYDNVHIKGTNLIAIPNPEAAVAGYGGLDGDPLTRYDNTFGVAGETPLQLDRTVETFSYSGAFNYRWKPELALYVRYSDGRKAPDLGIFIGATTPFNAANLVVKAQRVQQLEAGVKVQREKYNVFATPFYSLLSGVPIYTVTQNADNTIYNTPTIYNSLETFGLELESNYSFTDHFSFRFAGTLQRAIAKTARSWNVGAPGPQDDVIVSNSGNRSVNTPNVMFNIGPNYTTDKFSLFGNYRYLSNRAANTANTFYLKGFGQFDAGFGYNLTKALALQGNVTNLFNTLGVMGWAAPGGFPASLDNEGFTKAKREANPDAAYTVYSVAPRAYYLTATYKF